MPRDSTGPGSRLLLPGPFFLRSAPEHGGTSVGFVAGHRQVLSDSRIREKNRLNSMGRGIR